jgi:hypothetical protein
MAPVEPVIYCSVVAVSIDAIAMAAAIPRQIKRAMTATCPIQK